MDKFGFELWMKTLSIEEDITTVIHILTQHLTNNYMQYYLLALRKYADFSGRSRRKEYWMFVLFNLIFSIVLTIIDKLVFNSGDFGILSGIYTLGIIIPSIAIGVRRLHDIGKSGWMLLIVLIPLIGALWLLYLYVLEGNSGENAYGPDPKAGEQAA